MKYLGIYHITGPLPAWRITAMTNKRSWRRVHCFCLISISYLSLAGSGLSCTVLGQSAQKKRGLPSGGPSFSSAVYESLRAAASPMVGYWESVANQQFSLACVLLASRSRFSWLSKILESLRRGKRGTSLHRLSSPLPRSKFHGFCTVCLGIGKR